MNGPDAERGPIIDESQYLELGKIDNVILWEFLNSLGGSEQSLFFIKALLNDGWKIVAWLDGKAANVNEKARDINRRYPGSTLKQQTEYQVLDKAGTSIGTVYLRRDVHNPTNRY